VYVSVCILRVCARVCVCTYIYMCVCVYVRVCVRESVCQRIYIFTHRYIHTHENMCMCVDLVASTYLLELYIYVSVYFHKCVYVCM